MIREIEACHWDHNTHDFAMSARLITVVSVLLYFWQGRDVMGNSVSNMCMSELHERASQCT